MKNPLFMVRYPELRAGIDLSSANFSTFTEIVEVVLNEYDLLAEPLPANHAWKTGKRVHAAKAMAEAKELGPVLGMNEVETNVLAFLLLTHDIGRIVEGVIKQTEDDAKVHHGRESVAAIQNLVSRYPHLFPWKRESTFWDVVFYAIEHHSDIVTPEKVGQNSAAWALMSILRDLDKLAGFEKAYKYCNDPEEIAKQIGANNLVHGEACAVIPEKLIGDFESGRAIVRKECLSYEAFMLQLLAWRYDFNNQEIWQLAVDRGYVKHVLDYLSRQLAGQPKQLERILAAFNAA